MGIGTVQSGYEAYGYEMSTEAKKRKILGETEPEMASKDKTVE